MTGITNTKEVLQFITILGVLIGKEVSGDGLQITDVFKLFDNENFREKAARAFEDISSVTAELGDLSLSEGFDISLGAIEGFREILLAFGSLN